MSSKLLNKNSILYTTSRKKWETSLKSAENIIQRDKLRRSLINNVGQENTRSLKNIIDQAHSSPGTENHSPVWWEELGSRDLK